MIRIHVSRLLGERKERLADLIRSTGLARNTVAGLYHETTSRVDVETLNALCRHFGCSTGDLLEYVPDAEVAAAKCTTPNARSHVTSDTKASEPAQTVTRAR